MSRMFAFVLVLPLLAVGGSPRPSSAQRPSSTIARPGNGLVIGSLLPLGRREFTITSSTDCESDSGAPPAQIGSLVQETRVIGDTAVLFIREWHRPESAVVDTTAVELRTLAPLWNHAHFQQGASASWEFRGQRVLWSAVQPSGDTESVDSTVGERAFFAGSIDFFLAGTPRLYVPR